MERNIKDSQNFLHNKKLIQKLVEESNLSKEDTVYEIGPGKGMITEQLLARCKNVIAIELDNKLYQLLQDKFKNPKLTLINEDFMLTNLPDEKYKVFSNIPFNMTAEILTKLLTAPNPPQDMYIIMQYEAMLKYAGAPYYKDSLKSLMFKPMYDIKMVHEFDSADFTPKPNVSIVMVHFHKKKYCDIKKATMLEFWDFLSYVYAAPGKFFKEKTKKVFSYEQQKRLRKSINLDEDVTFSEWTYLQWVEIFNTYKQFVSDDKKKFVIGSYAKLLLEQSKLNRMHRNRQQKY
ncbi:TPA: 23S ribosomal RNA methyltransferase Erm [Enterobacter hormaechei]